MHRIKTQTLLPHESFNSKLGKRDVFCNATLYRTDAAMLKDGESCNRGESLPLNRYFFFIHPDILV